MKRGRETDKKGKLNKSGGRFIRIWEEGTRETEAEGHTKKTPAYDTFQSKGGKGAG